MGETKPGCSYPLNRTCFSPCAAGWSQERQVGGRRPAPSSDTAGCVSLGESFHPPLVQTQMLMLSKANLFVYLSVLSQWLGSPKQENTQSRGQEQSKVHLCSPVPMSHVTTLICPIPHTPDAWSAPRKCRHSERPVLSPAGASTDWGLVVRPPQQKAAVALEVSVPQPVCTSHHVSELGGTRTMNILKSQVFYNKAEHTF